VRAHVPPPQYVGGPLDGQRVEGRLCGYRDPAGRALHYRVLAHGEAVRIYNRDGTRHIGPRYNLTGNDLYLWSPQGSYGVLEWEVSAR
jgi:hypothetical protein